MSRVPFPPPSRRPTLASHRIVSHLHTAPSRATRRPRASGHHHGASPTNRRWFPHSHRRRRRRRRHRHRHRGTHARARHDTNASTRIARVRHSRRARAFIHYVTFVHASSSSSSSSIPANALLWPIMTHHRGTRARSVARL